MSDGRTHYYGDGCEPEHLRMNAYYFGFEPTDEPTVDRILSAVAVAGKAYHSTEFWDDDEWAKGEPTQVDRIQNAAMASAHEIEKLRADLRATGEVIANARAMATQLLFSGHPDWENLNRSLNALDAVQKAREGKA